MKSRAAVLAVTAAVVLGLIVPMTAVASPDSPSSEAAKSAISPPRAGAIKPTPKVDRPRPASDSASSIDFQARERGGRPAALGTGGASVAPLSIYDGGAAITAPTSGSTVGGAVDVTVDDSGCLSCDVLVVGIGPSGSEIERTVSFGGGPTTVSLPTWGLASGPSIVRATLCETYFDYDGVATECGGADTVSVAVSNPAPVLVAPANGQVVTGSTFTAAATATGGGVVFLVNGTIAGFASNAPYVVSIPSSIAPPGSRSVTAYSCSTDRSVCNWGSPSNSATVVLSRLSPTISVSPGVFSPNGDGRQDAARVGYTFDSTQSGQIRVRNSAGTTVLGPLPTGIRGRGSYAWTWNGRTRSGALAPNGRYSIALDTSSTSSGTTRYGQATTSVRVDLSAPVVSGLGASLATVYPVKDGYRDTTYLRATISEYARAVTIQVFNSSNRRVRSLALGARNAGGVGAAWNGRNDAGSILPAGTYRFRIVALDSAGNTRISGWSSVSSSMKRAVLAPFRITVTADQALDYMLKGTYYPSSYYDGAQLLWGDPVFDDPDQGEYSWALPSSLFPGSYRSVRVSSCVYRTYSSPLAYFAWVNSDATIVSSLTSLGNSEDSCYGSAQSAPSSAFSGRTVFWSVGNIDTLELSFWELAGFVITGSRYVLQ